MTTGKRPYRVKLSQLNPILVKELRQAVRSRFVAAAMLLFLLIELICTGTVLATSTINEVMSAANWHMGRQLFQVLLATLSGSCLLFVPAYTGLRLASERSDNNMDLFFITSITPSQVVRGKVLAGAVIALLLFSTALPFMSFTYLLRGIDLLSIFVILLLNFLIVVIATQAGVFLASIPMSRVFRILLALSVVSSSIWLIVMVNVFAAEMLSSGVGSMLYTSDFWKITGIVVGIAVTLHGLMYVLSVALLSPKSANRALPIRIVFTAVWLAWGVAITMIATAEKEGEIMLAWFMPSVIILSGILLITLSENDELSVRVRRRIPGLRPLRALAFLFYSGPVGGLIWVGLLVVLTFCLSHLNVTAIEGRWDSGWVDATGIVGGIILYVFAYGLTSLFVWRILFRGVLPRAAIWVGTLLLIAAGSILPVVVGLTLFKFDKQSLGAWQAGNIFALHDDKTRAAQLMWAGAWTVIAFICNVPWMIRTARDFRPLLPGEGKDTPMPNSQLPTSNAEEEEEKDPGLPEPK